VQSQTAKTAYFNPYLILFLGVLFASFGSLFSRMADAAPLAIAFYRMLFTSLIVAPVALIKCKEELNSLGRREIVASLVSGVFLALHFYTWITSLFYTTVASSTVLVTTHPLFVVIGSYLILKEKISAKAIFAGLVALGGVVFIGWGDFQIGQKALLGDFLAVCGAIMVAGYMLIGRKLRQSLSVISYIFLVYSSSTVILFILSLATATPLSSFSANTWLLFLALAVVPTIGGHSLFNWVLAYLPAPVVSISILGEPIGATLLALVFLGQIPSLTMLIGGSIILTGLLRFIMVTKG
jgi:drug/metabolite transporter (DMT)-like permease